MFSIAGKSRQPGEKTVPADIARAMSSWLSLMLIWIYAVFPAAVHSAVCPESRHEVVSHWLQSEEEVMGLIHAWHWWDDGI